MSTQTSDRTLMRLNVTVSRLQVVLSATIWFINGKLCVQISHFTETSFKQKILSGFTRENSPPVGPRLRAQNAVRSPKKASPRPRLTSSIGELSNPPKQTTTVSYIEYSNKLSPAEKRSVSTNCIWRYKNHKKMAINS